MPALANLDEAVKRAKAYEAVGFDAIFLAAGVTVEAAHVGSGSPYRPKPRFSATVQAVYDTLKPLREGVPSRELKKIAPS